MSRVAVAEPRSFSFQEAQARLGDLVYLLADYAQLSRGATGSVVDVHEPEKGKFEVVVRFEPPNVAEPIHYSFSKGKLNGLLSKR